MSARCPWVLPAITAVGCWGIEMGTRTESRVTSRFMVRDQHGRTDTVTERTDFMHVEDLSGVRSPPIPGLKEYLLDGRHLNKIDDDSFETPGGNLQFKRVRV